MLLLRMLPVATALATMVGVANAQPPSALVRGQDGGTSTDYYHLLQAGQRLYGERSWVAAADAYARLTDAYPWDGENWRRLGVAQYHAQEYRAAAHAFSKADEQGILPYPQWNAVNAARSYARAGQPDSALAWLEKALHEYRFGELATLAGDTAFGALRQEPRFRRLVRSAPERTFGRDEGWRYDLEYLLAEIQRLNPVYGSQPLPDSLVQAAARLRERIPALADHEIAVEMQHLLVLLGHNHNMFYPWLPEGRVKFTQLPLTFYAFPEGVYVADAAPGLEDLIGSRVLRFDSTSADSALRAMRYVVNRENDMELTWTGPRYLGMPQVLHALGLTRTPERVQLTLLDRHGRTRTVSPEAVPLQWGRKIEAPRLPDVPARPLYLSRPDDEFWFEHLPEQETVYLQFNQVRDKPDESLAQFAIRLRRFLAGHQVRNLVVDVRRNNGGNTYLNADLLRSLIAFDAGEGKRLFVLIGRSTFSAAANFITDVDRLTNAVFVGEPSGGKPITLGGDPSNTVLPFSGLPLGLTTGTWQLTSPGDTRLWISPDIPVALTAEDYLANRDPVLETVLGLISPEPADDRDAVRRAVVDYLEGFYEGDETKLQRSVWPQVSKHGYWRGSTAQAYRHMHMPYDEFMAFARGVREGRMRPPENAPRDIVLFEVQDQTASAKLTAWWGTDYLLLGKIDGRWMITHVLWQSTPVLGGHRSSSPE